MPVTGSRNTAWDACFSHAIPGHDLDTVILFYTCKCKSLVTATLRSRCSERHQSIRNQAQETEFHGTELQYDLEITIAALCLPLTLPETLRHGQQTHLSFPFSFSWNNLLTCPVSAVNEAFSEKKCLLYWM